MNTDDYLCHHEWIPLLMIQIFLNIEESVEEYMS